MSLRAARGQLTREADGTCMWRQDDQVNAYGQMRACWQTWDDEGVRWWRVDLGQVALPS